MGSIKQRDMKTTAMNLKSPIRASKHSYCAVYTDQISLISLDIQASVKKGYKILLKCRLTFP